MSDGDPSSSRATSKYLNSVGVTTKMNEQHRLAENIQVYLRAVQAATRDGLSDGVVFTRLNEALANVVGFKVLTVLKLDPTTLKSVRLYSSEPSYPIGGTKQHVRSAWSEAV